MNANKYLYNRRLERHMARDAIKEIRREQLIVATIDCIARKGFSELTLAEVAETAKLSTGIVNFYFKSKDALLIATLNHMVSDFQRLVANRKTVTVWYAFWGEARWRPDFMALCQELNREFQSVAANLFAQLGVKDPMLVAKGFSAMSDGLWLDMLINPKETDRDMARRVVRAFLHGLYPDYFAADAVEASTSAA
jgi:TetR/AcrR family transcriptional repressor of bet genes